MRGDKLAVSESIALSEWLYFRAPLSVQNILFSLHGWRLKRLRYTKAFFRHLASLKESEWWSRDAILDHQNRRFVEGVHNAYEHVPFYRWWFELHGVQPRQIKALDDIHRLPLLTKEVVREHQAAMVSEAFRKRKLVTALTSGTTGTPLSVYMSPDAVALQWAIWWRHKARFGLKPGHRHLMFGARVAVPPDQMKPPYWRVDAFGNRVYLSIHHISRNTVPDIVEFLNRERFEFFTGYPSGMHALATLIEEEGLRVYHKPRVLVLGSEELTPGAEAALGRVFGGLVTDQYGMAEFAGNLSRCELGRYHVDFECCYAEVAEGGDGEARPLILTGWGNPAMPFIRYQLGDGAIPGAGSCGCGRHSPWFEGVEGRCDDFVVTPDGRRITGLNQVVKVCQGARFVQVFQRISEEVEFRVVPGAEYGPEDEQALRAEFIKRAGTSVRLVIRHVEEPERSPSGKVRAVVSTLNGST